MNVVIVDYGMGNIRSLVTTLNYLNVQSIILSNKIEDFEKADRIILPGVGNFGKAIHQIKENRIDIALNKSVLEQKIPILGICLGMQLLGNSSSESGYNNGLSFINGEVREFDRSKVKVPHVGFNQVKVNFNSKLFDGIKDNSDFYFTHSFRMHSNDNINQSICNYQNDFIAGFEKANICGVQFHPELSQFNGLHLFRNFLNNF
ncbi:imidazole glycerol phosphate synthase subunit HisH [Aquirufa aurantiipilula]|uniref:imidazole glycerol phosphate synthase subunit HisH n=1 Tax=Aquirufa aurantiipilula TaxID=2696561 RepID=UPI001CAA5F7A|nr:imidazole glycerol phosphate synthase subunit HisH [Aquirufa aurantiipilula]MBZ1326594.1 imidazole glycerol phosphate synthase subunit HisH [Aquirufa aurantiipilula]